ncbi:MAG TPA: hypothetical protein VK906_14480 [Egicoccus sp.]|nr:hypothetical protein [Egicoccus sp.]HSK24388.1 hypothetical protein [Egicoccus sp.]
MVRCADCGIDLVADPGTEAPPEDVPLARLGIFHPRMATLVGEALRERGIRHEVRPAPDNGGTAVLVDPGWRDEVRAELALRWGELVAGLPEDEVVEVLASGGTAPGWFDPPRGGYVDRAGRLVVDPGEDEEAAQDASRIAGPALLTAGAILAISGWYVFDSTAVALAGVALLVVGLFIPR